MVTTGERKPWHAIFRLLERDERVFAVLLAVAMVAGLATLGLVPLRPRQQIDLNSLVLWFTLYKIGIFALVTVYPHAHAGHLPGALGIDLLLVFVLDVPHRRPETRSSTTCSFRCWRSTLTTSVRGWRSPPRSWPVASSRRRCARPAVRRLDALSILAALFGIPAVTVGIVAERERRARSEVERLNTQVTGTLNRLQATQQELVVAERMATVGRLSLRVAHEVRNPITAIELNAELLQDIVKEHRGSDMEEAGGLVTSIRDQVNDARRADRGVPRVRALSQAALRGGVPQPPPGRAGGLPASGRHPPGIRRSTWPTTRRRP